MSDTKPQAWCPFWLKAHIGGEGICPRLKGAHEALADLMREIQEEREAREKAEKALENIRGMCPDNGEFQGGGISDLDELSNEHRYMSQTIYRIASNALKTKAQAQEVKADG